MALSDITKSTTKYTVCAGDTFSEIAARCISVGMTAYAGLTVYNAGINKLKSFNPDVEDVNYIYKGQDLVLQGTAAKKTTTQAQRAKITAFGLQSNSNNVIYATWSWDKPQTKEYQVEWTYATGDGQVFPLTKETVTKKIHVCSSAPENAISVTFKVKPISKTFGENDRVYFTAGWSTAETYYFKDNPPEVPPVPALESEGSSYGISLDSEKAKVTIKLDLTNTKNSLSGLYLNASRVQFEILKNDTTKHNSGFADITSKGVATYKCDLTQGDTFKVRCRSFRGVKNGSKYSTTSGVYSDWSEYSAEFGTAPPATKGIKELYFWKNSSGKIVARVGWYAVASGKSYTVGYTADKEYFTSNPDGVTTKDGIKTTYTDIEIDDTGKEYFFAVKTAGGILSSSSPWSPISSLKIGDKPGQPTAWSNTSSAMVDDQIILYWAHNTTDNSPESFAQLDLRLNGVGITLNESGEYVTNTGSNYITIEKQKDEYGQVTSSTSSYSLSVPGNVFTEGAEISWAVRTAGIYEKDGNLVYSDWSDYQQIDVYAQPGLSLNATCAVVSDGITNDIPIGVVEDMDDEGVLTETPLLHFPITITAESLSNPDFQKPTGYHVTVTSVSEYETVDNIGNVKMVKADETIYSQHFDTNETLLSFDLNASDIDLENNQEYILTCILAMDSGLTAESSIPFLVAWTDDEVWPNVEIAYNKGSYTASLRPYCENLDGELIEGITLSVYRREFDGKFTEIGTDLPNVDEGWVTDPHPSLDYARYRVVAINDATGAVSFYDVPGYPINEKAVIIQWDDKWNNFEVTENGETTETPWAGSLLRLPYNIDVSDSYDPDVQFVEYIGRENPVSYYGTNLGQKSNWNVEIPKSDKETLYALRRLAIWMGDAYVREPSGSGYWANVSVSFSQTHCDLTIPVTLSITRVEGEK